LAVPENSENGGGANQADQLQLQQDEKAWIAYAKLICTAFIQRSDEIEGLLLRGRWDLDVELAAKRK
jgi:hypothetical protein